MALSDYALNTDDLEAINRYMQTTSVNTDAARTIKEKFTTWYDGLGYFDKYLDSTVQEASNRRNAFNVANTRSAAELNTVKQQLATGFSREETRGQPRVVDSAGNYPKQAGVTVLSAAKGTVPKGARPLIRQGSVGDPVKAWQKIIGVTVDGNFGPQTRAATVAWQREHGLTADGVVGSATWAAALGAVSDTNVPTAVAAVTPVAPVGQSAHDAEVGSILPIQSIQQPPTHVETKIPSQQVLAATLAPVVEAQKPVMTQAGMVPIPRIVKEHPIATIGVAAGTTAIGALIKKAFFG